MRITCRLCFHHTRNCQLYSVHMCSGEPLQFLSIGQHNHIQREDRCNVLRVSEAGLRATSLL